MKRKTHLLSIESINDPDTSLKLTSIYGEKTVTFSIFDKEGKSHATTVAPSDFQKMIDFLNWRLYAVEKTSVVNEDAYTPTGTGICIFDYKGDVLNTYYNTNGEGIFGGICDNSYLSLSNTYKTDKAIFAIFNTYDGSINRNLIIRIIQACIKHQNRFVTTGDIVFCNPMKIDDICDMVGVDKAVVSRCTSTVYIYGPNQSFTLDSYRGTPQRPSLFDEGVKRYGFYVGRVYVLHLIENMINAENKHRPLSDDDICAQLKSMGYEIERRTIAKYRDVILQIPNSNERREQ